MRKVWIALIIVFVILALVAGGAFWGWNYYQENLLYIDGTFYPLGITQLDLSGQPLPTLELLPQLTRLEKLDLQDTGLTEAQYLELQKALPACDILWDPFFQGALLDAGTESLTVEALSDEDLADLERFPALTSLTVSQPGSYQQLMALREARPGLQLTYAVEIGGDAFGSHRTQIRLRNADTAELSEKLQYLPNLDTVILAGRLPASDALEALGQQFPGITFKWEVTIYGVTAHSQDTRMDLSGIELKDTGVLEMVLPYLPAMEKVVLCGCGLSNETLLALRERWPQIQFVWNVTIGEHSFRTDVTEIDISGTRLQSVSDIESLLPCFTDLTQVVMSHCGISNPDMDALNRRYDDIKFVWTVYLGKTAMRTDATYFIPVKLGQEVTDEDIYNLRYCTDMLSVDLGHMDVTNCEFAAYMPHLKYLMLADTKVYSLEPLRGLKELVYLEIFTAPVYDYSPLLTCTALEDINMCYTFGQLDVICQMTWLKRLWWGGSGMQYYQSVLQAALPNTEMNLITTWSTGGGWRKGQNYYDMRDLMGMHYMEQD